MASQAYFSWVAAGKPWKFARPIQMVGDRLREHGYTVYYQGNQSHLEHVPPEDHTPFSATGWPSKSPYPYCMAMDIMPPAAGQKSKLTGKPLPSLQQLAARLRADKNADYGPAQFLKYMNWEPEGNNTGPCYHETWMPTYARRTSGDRGHIHASCRSDMHTSTVSDGYDLVARVMGDDDMSVQDVQEGELFFWQQAARGTNIPAGSTDPNDPYARAARTAVDKILDWSGIASPLGDAVKALTALVVQQSSATAADIAAALAPLIHVQDGATADEVEERIRKVLGGLDNTQS
jgi:hypothetical protein